MIRTKKTQVKEGVVRVERITPNGNYAMYDIIRAEKGYRFCDEKTNRYRRFACVPHGTDLSNLVVVKVKDEYGVI